MTAAQMPRGTFNKPPGGRPISYIQPERTNASQLTMDDRNICGFATLDIRTLHGRRCSVTESMPLDVKESELTPTQRSMMRTLEEVNRRNLAEALVGEAHVLAADEDEPTSNVRVEIVVRTTAMAWPDVPGVTTAPWRPLGPDLLYGAPGTITRIIDLRHQALTDGAWEFAMLVHPDFIAPAMFGPLESLGRLIPDPRIYYGLVRPCERIG
jgi:hypothetical protein